MNGGTGPMHHCRFASRSSNVTMHRSPYMPTQADGSRRWRPDQEQQHRLNVGDAYLLDLTDHALRHADTHVLRQCELCGKCLLCMRKPAGDLASVKPESANHGLPRSQSGTRLHMRKPRHSAKAFRSRSLHNGRLNTMPLHSYGVVKWPTTASSAIPSSLLSRAATALLLSGAGSPTCCPRRCSRSRSADPLACSRTLRCRWWRTGDRCCPTCSWR